MWAPGAYPTKVGLDAVEDVVRRLNGVVDEARAERHRRGYFAAMYRQMTRHVQRGIADGVFDDGERMARFVTLFASRYLDGLAAHRAGSPCPRAWRSAFETAERRNRLILQHIVLGINAHVNLDLGIAAAAVAPADEIHTLQNDFLRINHIIQSLLDPVQDAIGRFSPLLRLVWTVGDRADDEVLNFSFRVARDEAWRHALILARQPPEEHPATIDSFDRQAAVLARLVNDPGRIVTAVVQLTERDDVPDVIDALGAVAAPRALETPPLP